MGYLSDSMLLIAEEEQSAFRELYDRYWEQLYKKAMNRLGNDADAQDAVQEVFISCWRNRKTIEVKETLSPYLYTALKYCIIKKIYRQTKKGITVPLSTEALAQTELSTEEFLQYKELQHLIEDEVNKLPEKMQQIYRLSRTENLPISTIAENLQISEQTVKNTLTSALKRLREGLSRYSSFIPFLL